MSIGSLFSKDSRKQTKEFLRFREIPEKTDSQNYFCPVVFSGHLYPGKINHIPET